MTSADGTVVPEDQVRDSALYLCIYLGLVLVLAVAVGLTGSDPVSSGAAAEMAGLPRVMFLDLCADYDIPISQITPEEMRSELDHGQTQPG